MSMPCECGSKSNCLDSRPRADRSVTRRYLCRSCGTRWTTSEIVVSKEASKKRKVTQTYAQTLMVDLERKAKTNVLERMIREMN